MGPRLIHAVIGACVVLGLACGGDGRVQRYPDVDEELERQSEGIEESPERRAQPPTRTHGPYPQDELAGEETEPL